MVSTKTLYRPVGPAELELIREVVGLADRILTLAPGCDHAQVKVNVVDGETVDLRVIVGEIRQKPR